MREIFDGFPWRAVAQVKTIPRGRTRQFQGVETIPRGRESMMRLAAV
jgi:hypothetical protein